MKTLYRKDNSCNTPFKDLMDKALKDYDEASRLAHHFNSDIPKAIIKFYTDKIEAQPEQPVYDKQYLNDCIEKATPGLSKIEDVDKALDEIRGIEPKEISVTDGEIETHAKEYLKAIHTPITKREVHELLVIFGHWVRGKLKRTI